MGWSLLIWETMEESRKSHTLLPSGFFCSAEYSRLRAILWSYTVWHRLLCAIKLPSLPMPRGLPLTIEGERSLPTVSLKMCWDCPGWACWDGLRPSRFEHHDCCQPCNSSIPLSCAWLEFGIAVSEGRKVCMPASSPVFFQLYELV